MVTAKAARLESAPELVVVTGSEGLIGSRIVKALAQKYRIVGLDVKKSPTRGSESEFIQCDLTRDASVDAALTQIERSHGRRIASMIHLAAYYDFSGEPSPLY